MLLGEGYELITKRGLPEITLLYKCFQSNNKQEAIERKKLLVLFKVFNILRLKGNNCLFDSLEKQKKINFIHSFSVFK